MQMKPKARMTRFRPAPLAIAAVAMALAVPATAQEPQKPITEQEPDAVDVATTPMTDLNLRKGEIPPVLLAAQANPYTVENLGRCSQIAAAVGEFDAVLGDDIDLPQTDEKSVSTGRVAQWVVGSFIPFRGLIREVSGANAQQRKVQAAIEAGIARRSFLKGLGQAKGCRYPARPATPEVVSARMDAIQRELDKKAEKDKAGDEDKGTK